MTVAAADALFPTADVPTTGSTRAARILAAAEPAVELPVLVTRDGAINKVTHMQAAEGLLAMAHIHGVITVDVETSGYPIGHPNYALRTIQLGDADGAYVLDASERKALMVTNIALHVAQRLAAYSATADLVPLVHAGVTDYDTAWSKMHDTMITAKLADPNTIGTDAGLKTTAAQLLGENAVSPSADRDRAELFAAGGWLTDVDLETPLARNGWYQVNPRMERMVRYAAADVLDTAALARRLPTPDPSVLERERAVQRMTARISHDGLRLDGDRVAELVDASSTLVDSARIECVGLGISDPASTTVVAHALANAGADLPLTEKGNPSVTATVLEDLARGEGDASSLAKAVMGYREPATLLSTFLTPYQLLCENGDGRVRPTIYTLSARTGRMSCVRPNCQNVPREGGIRGCITADPGHLLVSADLAGIELRVAAALSGDSTLRAAAVDGNSKDKTDIHWLVAKQVFGPDATKADRYTVKPGVYGHMYGAGVPTLAAQMGCSDDIASAVVEGLTSLTPQYAQWAKELRYAVKDGRTTHPLYTGTELQLPQDYPHKAPNYVIQRTAREVLVDGMLRWRDTQWGASILLPVHDELIAMVPEQEAVDATAALVECMTGSVGVVPVVAEANEPSFAWRDAT